jgi:S-adenosyl-L-methionine hydrolase (adenosine-forming)
MSTIITLLTDFGLQDTYVGQMKGAILSRCPEAVIIDLSHGIGAQRVREGAFLLGAALPAFPHGTVHLAVVDPGVGSARRSIAIETADAWFVGPDNGLLSAALPEAARPDSGEATDVDLPQGVRAVAIDWRRLTARPPSTTFHGRDIFAPAAAHLAAGNPLQSLGPSVGRVVAFPAFRARATGDGRVEATVLTVDRFGNLITDCRAEQAPEPRVRIVVAGEVIAGPAGTYAEAAPGTFVVVVGSSGYIEIARVNGDAAAALGLAAGDSVMIAPA